MKPEEIKVLIVDDIPSARKVLQRMLTALGYRAIDEAGSLKEAVDRLGANSFDLVISDVHLRDGKGTELLRQINDKTPALPVILVTSDMDRATFDEASSIRPTAYLLKPFSPQSLNEKIQLLLKSLS